MIFSPFRIRSWSQALTWVAWLMNTFSRSSSSMVHLLMFSSSCLKVRLAPDAAELVVLVTLVRLAWLVPAPRVNPRK